MMRSYVSMGDSHGSSSGNFNNHLQRAPDSADSQPFQSATVNMALSGHQPTLEMPKALEYRNFMEFPRVQDDVRMKFYNALKYAHAKADRSLDSLARRLPRSYIDSVKERADHHKNLLPHDHRSRHEKEKSNQIWKHLRPQGTTKGLPVRLSNAKYDVVFARRRSRLAVHENGSS